MNKMLRILLILWQLPQAIVGSIVYLFVKNNIKDTYQRGFVKCYFAKNFPGGLSLSPFIFINYYKLYNITYINHEYGHYLQSLYLGPFYLIVIGVPSIIWSTLYGRIINKTPNGYYKFYTEKWADKLGDIKRA